MKSEYASTMSNDLVGQLHDVIQINIDSRDGFLYAADRLQESESKLQNMFRQAASERSSFVDELEGFVQRNENYQHTEGSFTASLHRTWMSIRDSFANKYDIYAVVAEAERGEDAIKSVYEEALSTVRGVNSSLESVLNRQYKSVKATHDQIRDLRDSLKPSKS